MLPLVGWPPRCLLRAATGVPCPFCGMTTGVLATLHGDLGDAVLANPAAPALVVVVATFAGAIALRSLNVRARLPGVSVQRTVGVVQRWRWPLLAAMWAFQLHRFALR